MAYGKQKSKRGGFMGNLVKIGGAKRKLSLTGDFRPENTASGGFKRARKQAHKKA